MNSTEQINQQAIAAAEAARDAIVAPLFDAYRAIADAATYPYSPAEMAAYRAYIEALPAAHAAYDAVMAASRAAK